MKKLFTLLIVLAFIDNVFAQWVAQTSGIPGSLSSVFFTDVNTGYAVGYYVNPGYPIGNYGHLSLWELTD